MTCSSLACLGKKASAFLGVWTFQHNMYVFKDTQMQGFDPKLFWSPSNGSTRRLSHLLLIKPDRSQVLTLAMGERWETSLSIRHRYRTCMDASEQTLVITDVAGCILLQGPLGAAGAEGRQGEKGAKVNVSTSPPFLSKIFIFVLNRF